MPWFEFTQNNSGGSFDVDDKVCHRMFIEAPTVRVACAMAEDLGVYFDGVDSGRDCPCCGDRWSSPWTDDGLTFPMEYSRDRTFANVEEYAQHLADNYGWTTPDYRLFYTDGRVIEGGAQR